MYGLVIARGKMALLGLLLWPLVLSIGFAGLEVMVFIMCCAFIVRMVQGLRSPVWLSKVSAPTKVQIVPRPLDAAGE